MKTKTIFKALALAMLMPAMVLTTACSNDDNLVNNTANTENTINKGYALPVTVNVTRQGDAATTRATYTDNGDGTGSLAFSAGDKLFIRGYYNDFYNEFAGTLEYDTESGKFSGTIYTQDDTYSTYEALFAASEKTSATLLPAGYEDHGYLVIKTNDTDAQYDDYIEGSSEYTLATSKADGVAQFSYEEATEYDKGFALSPNNAILNFTVTGLAASTSVNVSLTSMAYNITGTVTTDGDGNAKFAAGIMGELNLQPFSLTVGGNPITLVSSDKEVAKGKIYNITRAVTPPTLAQTMTTAGMTVKVKYNYADAVNYCLFSSVGDGTYTFQSGSGFAGGDEGCAKALVVEGGKLVFKQNFFDAIDFQWSDRGFSVTFDTSNDTYIQWVGSWVQAKYNPSFISVEVNSVDITSSLTNATPVETTITWNSSNISNLEVIGTFASYEKEGITLSANSDQNNAGWYDYGDESMNGIYFSTNRSGGFTFTAPTGKKFSKIEMTLNGSGEWDHASLGTGWAFVEDFDDYYMNMIYKVTWTGTAANTVDLLTGDDNFGGGSVKSIVFTVY